MRSLILSNLKMKNQPPGAMGFVFLLDRINMILQDIFPMP